MRTANENLPQASGGDASPGSASPVPGPGAGTQPPGLLVLTPGALRAVAVPPLQRERPEWIVLAWAGAALGAVGLVDLVTTWMPMGLGSSEWEFATVSATLGLVPLPALGLLVMLAAGLARGSRDIVRIAAGSLVGLGVLLIVAALLYVRSAPVALRVATDDSVRRGIVKAIIGGGARLIVYPTLCFFAARKGWTSLGNSWQAVRGLPSSHPDNIR